MSNPCSPIEKTRRARLGVKLSLDQFFRADHVVYTRTAGSHARFEAELDVISAAAGKTRNVALRLSHSLGIDRVVASSDLIACVPSRLASALSSSDDIRALALPVDITPGDISQFWHERHHRDDGHQWLRSLIYELFHDKRPSALG